MIANIIIILVLSVLICTMMHTLYTPQYRIKLVNNKFVVEKYDFCESACYCFASVRCWQQIGYASKIGDAKAIIEQDKSVSK